MKSGELANRLNVSDATIRKWSVQYANFLSKRGRGLAPGATRIFSEEDALILATIAELRDLGLTHDQITESLKKGRRTEAVPELPTEEEEQARQAVALVPVDQLHRALDRITLLEDEIARIERERDSERMAREEAERRIRELEREAGRLEGETALLREMLEDEKARKRGLFGR